MRLDREIGEHDDFIYRNYYFLSIEKKWGKKQQQRAHTRHRINIIINSCKSSDFKRFSHTDHPLFQFTCISVCLFVCVGCSAICLLFFLLQTLLSLSLPVVYRQVKMIICFVKLGENNKSSTALVFINSVKRRRRRWK